MKYKMRYRGRQKSRPCCAVELELGVFDGAAHGSFRRWQWPSDLDLDSMFPVHDIPHLILYTTDVGETLPSYLSNHRRLSASSLSARNV